MSSKYTIMFIGFIIFASSFAEAKLKAKKKISTKKYDYNSNVYRIKYYGTCEKEKCGKNLYCVDGKCIKSLDGEKGSYCSIWSWIICGKGLNCVNYICIDKSKNAIIRYVPAY